MPEIHPAAAPAVSLYVDSEANTKRNAQAEPSPTAALSAAVSAALAQQSSLHDKTSDRLVEEFFYLASLRARVINMQNSYSPGGFIASPLKISAKSEKQFESYVQKSYTNCIELLKEEDRKRHEERRNIMGSE